MVLEENKYRAQILQIGGFALMTPAAKIYLSILDFKLSDLSVKFFIYSLVSMFFLYLGIILLVRGIEMLKESE